MQERKLPALSEAILVAAAKSKHPLLLRSSRQVEPNTIHSLQLGVGHGTLTSTGGVSFSENVSLPALLQYSLALTHVFLCFRLPCLTLQACRLARSARSGPPSCGHLPTILFALLFCLILVTSC